MKKSTGIPISATYVSTNDGPPVLVSQETISAKEFAFRLMHSPAIIQAAKDYAAQKNQAIKS